MDRPSMLRKTSCQVPSLLALAVALLCAVGPSCGSEGPESETPRPARETPSSSAPAPPSARLEVLASPDRRAVPSLEPTATAPVASVASDNPGAEPKPERFETLRGRVRAPDGTPMVGSQLVVFPAELEVTHFTPGSIDFQAGTPGGQRWRASTRTDAHGRFEVAELGSTQWKVYGVRPSSGDHPVHLLTPLPVDAGGPELDLVWSRPRILVRVQDEAGAPWTGELGFSPEGGRQLCLLVYLLPDPDDPKAADADPRDEPLSGTTLEPGLIAFDVSEGREYLVGLFGGRQAWDPVTVTVAPGAGALELPRTVLDHESGELEIECPSGKAVMVSLGDPRHGVDLLRRSFSSQETPFRLSLPAGEYRIQADRVVFATCGYTPPPPREHAPFEAIVRVRRLETAIVRTDYPAGGRLHVRLLGEVHEEDRRAIRAEQRKLPPAVESCFLAPELHLAGKGRARYRVLFQDATTWSGMRSAPEFGAEATSELLPAGRFTLHARMPGGRVASAPVELVDGRTTEITLRFD